MVTGIFMIFLQIINMVQNHEAGSRYILVALKVMLSIFLNWFMMSGADLCGMAVEFDPSHQ